MGGILIDSHIEPECRISCIISGGVRLSQAFIILSDKKSLRCPRALSRRVIENYSRYNYTRTGSSLFVESIFRCYFELICRNLSVAVGSRTRVSGCKETSERLIYTHAADPGKECKQQMVAPARRPAMNQQLRMTRKDVLKEGRSYKASINLHLRRRGIA